MKRSKNIFVILVIILTIILLYWFIKLFIVNRNEYNSIKENMVVAENNFQRLKTERENYPSVKKIREKHVQNFDTLSVHIPLKESVRGTNSYIETLDIIRKIAEKNNITINKFNPILINTFPNIVVEDQNIKQSVKRYTVEMECNGDFLELGKFFEELQNLNRYISLLNFDIETEYGIEGRLRCKAMFYTYMLVG